VTPETAALLAAVAIAILRELVDALDRRRRRAGRRRTRRDD
jgi:hypothetical protein